ncbi:MAG: Dabb family protein [Planctomycetota bacterium]
MSRPSTLVSFALIAVVGLVLAGTLCCTAADDASAEPPAEGALLRHVVLFKFKDGTSDADVKKIEDAFRSLPNKVPEIVDFEWGTNNSPEGKAEGFTHCFFLTFKDAKGRDIYLPHPAHKEFGNVLRPHLDKVLVVDYFVQK